MYVLSIVLSLITIVGLGVLFYWGVIETLQVEGKPRVIFIVIIVATIVFSMSNLIVENVISKRITNFLPSESQSDIATIDYMDIAVEVSLNDMGKELVKTLGEDDIELCSVFRKVGSEHVYIQVEMQNGSVREFDFSEQNFYLLMPYIEMQKLPLVE